MSPGRRSDVIALTALSLLAAGCVADDPPASQGSGPASRSPRRVFAGHDHEQTGELPSGNRGAAVVRRAFAAGDLDGSFPDSVRQMYKAAGSKIKELKIYPTALHGTQLTNDAEGLADLLEFLDRVAPPR